MRTTLALLAALLLAGCVMDPTAIGPSPIPPERWQIDFGSEQWIVVSNTQTRGYRMKEYVPVGQTGDNWREITTDQFIVGRFPTTTYFMQLNLADLARQVNGFQSKVIYDTGGEAVYEWWHPDSGQWPAEDQLCLVKYYPGGMMTLSYAHKGPQMDEAQRTKWLDRFKSAKLQ